MQGPEGYTIAAIAALNIAEKILNGNFTPGYQTPAKAYSGDLVLEIEGVTRTDIYRDRREAVRTVSMPIDIFI